MPYCNYTYNQTAFSNILQYGKLIIYNNQLYFGNSSNQPTAITVDLSSYATTNYVSTNYATKNHTHSDYAPKANPTFTGNIHLNSSTIRFGANSSNSLCKINIGDGDYIHFYEYEDDKLEIKGSTINMATSNFLVNGTALGSDTPSVSGTVTCTTSTTMTVNVGFQPTLVFVVTYGGSIGRFGYIVYEGGTYCQFLKSGADGWAGTYESGRPSNGFYIPKNSFGDGWTLFYVAFK